MQQQTIFRNSVCINLSLLILIKVYNIVIPRNNINRWYHRSTNSLMYICVYVFQIILTILSLSSATTIWLFRLNFKEKITTTFELFRVFFLSVSNIDRRRNVLMSKTRSIVQTNIILSLSFSLSAFYSTLTYALKYS